MFLVHAIMDALGIMYPYYYLKLDCDVSFGNQLQVLKVTSYHGKTQTLDGQVVQVHELLNASDLECQHGMFKLTMKSNVTDCPPPPRPPLPPFDQDVAFGDNISHFGYQLS